MTSGQIDPTLRGPAVPPGSERGFPRSDAPRPRRRRPLGWLPSLARARQGLTIALVGMVAFSGYGMLTPAPLRCALPGSVGCPGGWFAAPIPGANATNEQYFNVTMYDWGFWIINTANGTNETKNWNVYEGWTIHVNATSLPANTAIGGTAYHGIGIELNATGQHLLTVNAGVNKWVSGSFVAPNSVYRHQHIWCTIECGPGHGSQEMFNLNVIPSTSVPLASARATPSSGTAPLAVAFTSTVSGGSPPYTASWNFGDGSAAGTTLNVSHTYTLSGTYSAKLTITDSKSGTTSATAKVTVTSAAPLTVSASATPASGVAPVAVTLAGTAAGGVAPYTYAWTLGDGAKLSTASGIHLYTAPGAYALQLTVTDSTGASASGSANVAVVAPTGTFAVAATATPVGGAIPLGVTLSETPTGGTAPYTATWMFGDGSVGAGASVSHSYTVNGNYEATVYVSDAGGLVGTATTAVTATGAAGAPLTARLVETPSSGTPPLNVTASVSVSGGTGPYGSPSWSFGDGASASGQVAGHQYTKLGHYNVTVSVADALGVTASATSPVVVAGLQMSIVLNRTGGDAPLALGADASIVGGTGKYNPVHWTWGDGTTSTGAPANHTYAVTVVGPVQVQASVTDSAGATATASASLTISGPPAGNLTFSMPSNALPPVEVNFTFTAAGGSGGYSPTPLWSFGDSTTTRGPSPQNHTYAVAGHYRVYVLSNDSAGVPINVSTWVNVSGGAATSGGGGGGGASSWTFSGVGNPDQAALGLLGLVGLSGLFLMWRDRQRKAAKAPASARPPTTSVASRAYGSASSLFGKTPPR